jgi:hypothetical protein
MHDSDDRFIYGANNVGLACTYEGAGAWRAIKFLIKQHMLICYSSFLQTIHFCKHQSKTFIVLHSVGT